MLTKPHIMHEKCIEFRSIFCSNEQAFCPWLPEDGFNLVYGKDSSSKIHLSFLQLLCQPPPHYPGICPLKDSNISWKVWGQRGHHLIFDSEIKMASIPKWVVEATILFTFINMLVNWSILIAVTKLFSYV